MVRIMMALLRLAILCGLCGTAHANTTAVFMAQQAIPDVSVPPAGGRVYNLPPAAPEQEAVSVPNMPAAVRIALLLPLASEALGRAAEAVRGGFEAAYQVDRQNLLINVIESGDSPAAILAAYAGVSATHDIVVGPLTRSGVTAIAQRGAVRKPTIALTQPEAANDIDTVLPQNMVSMGLSVEDEARQSATSLGGDAMMGTAFIISGNAAWQKRAAKAFAAQWQRQGRTAQSMELSISSGNVSPSGLLQLRKRLQAENPSFLFVALDGDQTRQLRSAIGRDAVIYGTSQLNALSLESKEPTDATIELNGVHLLDIPWQLQADHPAVRTYPHPVVAADQKRSADLERLYALGIDAYRVVLEVASGRTDFIVDGVTGRLNVSVGGGLSRFERVSQPAMYQNGLVVPVLGAR